MGMLADLLKTDVTPESASVGGALRFLGRELLWSCGGVVDQLGEEHGACGRQRAPRCGGRAPHELISQQERPG